MSILCLLSCSAFSLPSDNNEPVYLQAGTASLNQLTHEGIYTNHVKLDQGNMHLRAAYAVIKGDTKNQLIYAMAQGKATQQAHIWTLTDADKPPFHAYADTIHYYPQEHRVELIGHAQIKQGANQFNAPEIHYDTIKQHLITKQHKNERTTIILQPSSLK